MNQATAREEEAEAPLTADQVQRHLDAVAQSVDRRLRSLEARILVLEQAGAATVRCGTELTQRVDRLEAEAWRRRF